MHYANRRGLGFTDLHGHMNKRGVRAWQRSKARTPRPDARTPDCARSIPRTSTHACNFTEKNMRTEDKNGQTKEGAVGWRYTPRRDCRTCTRWRQTTCRRGCSRGSAGERGRRPRVAPVAQPRPVKHIPEVLNDVGRALMIAALDLQGEGANPWSRLPGSRRPRGSARDGRGARRGETRAKRGDVTVAVARSGGR